MTFDYSRDFFEEGFPLQLSTEQNISFKNPIVGLTGLENKVTTFIAASNGKIYAVSGNGKGLLYNQKLDVAKYSGNSFPDIALADTDSDDQYDRLITCGFSGEVDIYQFTDQDADSLIDTVNTISYNEQFTTAPIVYTPYFFIGTESGRIMRFSLSDGSLDSTFNFTDPIVAFTVLTPSEIEVVEKTSSETTIPPAIIDLNSDGSYETLLFPNPDKIIIESDDQSRVIQLVRFDCF